MPVPKLDGPTEYTIAQAMMAELIDYLKADVVYWRVAPTRLGDKMPPLTIGGLLEATARATAAAADLTPDQLTQLNGFTARFDQIRATHPVALAARAMRELNSRLDAWSTYIDDVTRLPGDAAPYYPQEVRARAKAQLLARALDQNLPAAALQRINSLDARLRRSWATGAFVWDDRLQAVFPAASCWWLYGHVQI